jgi:hypothetical protein
MRVLGSVVICAFLAGCADGGIGRRGSVAWSWTADESAKYDYYRAQCVQMGIKLNTPEMEVCIASAPSGRRGGGGGGNSYNSNMNTSCQYQGYNGYNPIKGGCY